MTAKAHPNPADAAMAARIYQPPKSATSSGLARTKLWLIEFEQTEARQIEPLMGWTSSGDTQQQIKLRFDTLEEAVAYAEREGITYRVEQSQTSAPRTMAYSDNFKFNRIGSWTH